MKQILLFELKLQAAAARLSCLDVWNRQKEERKAWSSDVAALVGPNPSLDSEFRVSSLELAFDVQLDLDYAHRHYNLCLDFSGVYNITLTFI